MSHAILNSPEITVFCHHTMCLTVGPMRGKVVSILLVIEYTCMDSFYCPSGEQALEQFNFGCSSQEQWTFNQVPMLIMAP